MIIEEGVLLNLILMLFVIAYLIYTIVYHNSVRFIKKEFHKRDLSFIKRLDMDINELNPFTARRNSDIRKMHYDPEWFIALMYYDKILYSENGIEKEAWIKVSFMAPGITQLVFYDDVVKH